MKGKLALSGLMKRSFAAQAQAARKSEPNNLAKGELKTKVLPNGMTVASLENLSPVSRIGVFVRAGPRFETSKEAGVSHLIRYAAGMHTQNFTIFGITRNMEYSGASLTASSTRDDIIYQMNGLRESMKDNFKYLADTIARPAFKFWQLDDYKYRLEVEIERSKLDPQQVLLDEVHRIAFKGGLSNSLFASKEVIEHHDPEHLSEMLHHYHSRNFVNKRTTVIGIGVDQDRLLEHVDKAFGLPDLSGPELVKSKFIGGESRIIMDADRDQTLAVIGTEGVSAENLKDVATYTLLQAILATGVHTKKGVGASKLAQAAAKVAKAPFRVNGVNINYADTGLFGFAIACHASESGDIVKAVVAKMKETCKNLKEEDLQHAKNHVKGSFALSLEDQNNLLDHLGMILTNHNEIKSVDDMEKLVDGITLKDVSAAAAKIMKTKGTLVSVGNLDNMCYLDELTA